MASDDKKTKADPVQKKAAPCKERRKSTADAAPAKAEGGEKEAGSPSGYHRGEGQKPVTQAYKDNWNLIFGGRRRSDDPPLSERLTNNSTRHPAPSARGQDHQGPFAAAKPASAHVSSKCAGNCPVLKMMVGSSS